MFAFAYWKFYFIMKTQYIRKKIKLMKENKKVKQKMHKQRKWKKNTLYITTAILYVLELNKTEKEATLNKYQYWDNSRNLSSFYTTATPTR